MDQPVRIRIAEPSDAKQIMAVINSAFRIAEDFFCGEDRITLEEVERLFTAGTFLLAEMDRVLGGCVYVELRGDRSYLGLLSVDPSQQQSGLGSFLMNAAEQHCRERGSSFMDIYLVNLRTELFPFYQKRGYAETGTLPFPPEIPTRLPCHFITMAKQL
ncbi:MAG TPA: GNAT family N-acetyltransferase [Pyrinomonadaceae bacterium]|nr:GNAT family N-acetyltransferase [Pyrinomonadaceae bacterium]